MNLIERVKAHEPEAIEAAIQIIEDYDGLWDENIQARDELADGRLHALDAYKALELAYELVPLLPLKNAKKSEEIIQKGFKQALERCSKNIARILEEIY